MGFIRLKYPSTAVNTKRRMKTDEFRRDSYYSFIRLKISQKKKTLYFKKKYQIQATRPAFAEKYLKFSYFVYIHVLDI